MAALHGGSSAVQSYKETKSEKEKEKAALLEALQVKLRAQLDLAEVRTGGVGWDCGFVHFHRV
jgi:hypothetical protein